MLVIEWIVEIVVRGLDLGCMTLFRRGLLGLGGGVMFGMSVLLLVLESTLWLICLQNP